MTQSFLSFQAARCDTSRGRADTQVKVSATASNLAANAKTLALRGLGRPAPGRVTRTDLKSDSEQYPLAISWTIRNATEKNCSKSRVSVPCEIGSGHAPLPTGNLVRIACYAVTSGPLRLVPMVVSYSLCGASSASYTSSLAEAFAHQPNLLNQSLP